MNAGPALILVGGGGHCLSCIDVIEAEGRYRIAGVLDAPGQVGRKLGGYEVVGTDSDIGKLAGEGCAFLVTLGQIKSARRRQEIFASLKARGAAIATVISPEARVARSAKVGEGTIVMHHALLVAAASVGENCIVNSKALLEHGARVGSHCHISTGALINGEAEIGDRTFVGSGAVVAQGIRVAEGCVLGAGAVAIRPVDTPGTYVGNPLRKVPS